MNDFQRTLANVAMVPAGERLRGLQNQPKRPSIQPKNGRTSKRRILGGREPVNVQTVIPAPFISSFP